MKVKKNSTLFTILMGSRMYGTATETSDYDYKSVCLPALDDLLLNLKLVNNKEKPEGMKQTDKMVAGGSETEFLPLQVFLNDFISGQTYALEMVFALANGDAVINPNQSPKDQFNDGVFFEDMANTLITRFLTKNMKKMVGYAVSQSKLYGLKTERYTSMKQFAAMIKSYLDLQDSHNGIHTRDITLLQAETLRANLLTIPHVKSIVIEDEQSEAGHNAVEVCGKRFPLTNKLEYVFDRVNKMLETYGHRVQSNEGEGVDWKALSHAIRITEQVLELCTTKQLIFPRPNADYLLAVKRGEVTLDEATAYLDGAFGKIDEAVANSELQEVTPELQAEFKKWTLTVLHELYDLN
jgi:hypothetical protein